MSNLVFVSGDFSSGTTLLFTLFRKTGDFYCLYEPLHEKLLEYLIYPLRPDEHHLHVEPYFTEYKGFTAIAKLFKPEWGVSQLYMPPEMEADAFYRYWSYLIGSAFGRKAKVMLKENRLTFRLGWLRAKFPSAKIIHIYRDKQKQWNSIVRRGQEYLGREDIGQHSVNFAGFDVARWCDELASIYPELDARRFANGFERYSVLWDLSFAEHKKYADISVDYYQLTHDFEATCAQIGQCIGYEFDIQALKPYIVPPEQQKQIPIRRSDPRKRLIDLVDRAGSKYAKARLRARALLRGDSASESLLAARPSRKAE